MGSREEPQPPNYDMVCNGSAKLQCGFVVSRIQDPPAGAHAASASDVPATVEAAPVLFVPESCRATQTKTPRDRASYIQVESTVGVSLSREAGGCECGNQPREGSTTSDCGW